MIKLIKSIFTPKPKGCQVRHYKEAGEKLDDRMVEVIRLDDRRNEYGRLEFGIYECTECKRRSFMTGVAFIQSHKVTGAVDNFINHVIDLESFKTALSYHRMIYQVTATGEKND